MTCVVHAFLPGALARMVCGPPSMGIGVANSAASMGVPSRSTTRPATRLSCGTVTMMRARSGSIFSARPRAAISQSAWPELREAAAASLYVAPALAS